MTLADMPTDLTKLIAICPRNNVRVMSNRWRQMTVIGDEAIWWKCPECADWHLIVIERKKEGEKKGGGEG